MRSKKRTNTTHLALRYEADFVSHLEERFHLSRATARALLESWMQGLGPGGSAADDPDNALSVRRRIEDWVEVGLDRVGCADKEFSVRQGARG